MMINSILIQYRASIELRMKRNAYAKLFDIQPYDVRVLISGSFITKTSCVETQLKNATAEAIGSEWILVAETGEEVQPKSRFLYHAELSYEDKEDRP